MALLQPFTTTGQALVNVDYTDFAEGTGIQEFYAGAVKTSSATSYILRDRVFKCYYATNYISFDTNSGGTPTKVQDLDFDLSAFNTPKAIKGTAIVQVPVSNGGNGVQNYVIVKIRKYSGTTETEVASAQSPILTNSVQQYVVMPIVVPYTYYAQGDILRVTLEFWANMGSGLTSNNSIGFDPEGSAIDTPGSFDFSAGNSIMKFSIPFNLEEI